MSVPAHYGVRLLPHNENFALSRNLETEVTFYDYTDIFGVFAKGYLSAFLGRFEKLFVVTMGTEEDFKAFVVLH